MSVRQRYHLHICLVRNEDPALENALQLALSDDFFLSWDLIGAPIELNNFSRRQIDSCDYLLFILGDSYGAVDLTGVSALHLSYIYATTKRRPMLTLIKSETSAGEFSRQRIDFAAFIEKDAHQLVQKPIYYNDFRDALVKFNIALDSLLQSNPKPAWQYSDQPSDAHDIWLSAPSMTKDTTSPSHTLTSSTGDALALPNQTMSNTGSSLPHPAPITDEPVIVNYSAHAFRAGNLQTIIGNHMFVWGDLLNALKTLVPPFSTDMLQKRLSELLKDVAMQEACKRFPDVHAVSRCQLNSTDMQWLKTQLVNKNWLLKASDTRDIRELWQLHPILD